MKSNFSSQYSYPHAHYIYNEEGIPMHKDDYEKAYGKHHETDGKPTKKQQTSTNSGPNSDGQLFNRLVRKA